MLIPTGKPYLHGRRWHVDYTNDAGTIVNRVSFDKSPEQKTVDAALASVAAQMEADAVISAQAAAKESVWQEWLAKEGGIEALKAKVIADPTTTVGKAAVK
jgi:hypothetical protein